MDLEEFRQQLYARRRERYEQRMREQARARLVDPGEVEMLGSSGPEVEVHEEQPEQNPFEQAQEIIARGDVTEQDKEVLRGIAEPFLPKNVTDKMWAMAGKYGGIGAKVYLPQALTGLVAEGQDEFEIYMTEPDQLLRGVASALYPNHTVTEDYQDMEYDVEFAHRPSLHSVDTAALRNGGVVVFQVPSIELEDLQERRRLGREGRLMEAYSTPQGVIGVIRREPGVPNDYAGYFSRNPEMVLADVGEIPLLGDVPEPPNIPEDWPYRRLADEAGTVTDSEKERIEEASGYAAKAMMMERLKTLWD